MRGKGGTDITPNLAHIGHILQQAGNTEGWRLTQVYETYFEIRAPHPNGKPNWWVGVADMHTSKEMAEAFFAAIVAAGRNSSEGYKCLTSN